jgi:hypothetical protein
MLGAAAVLTGVVVAVQNFAAIDWGYFPVPLWIATGYPNVIWNL